MCINNMHQKTNKTILHIFSTFAIGGPQVRFAQIANGLDDSFKHIIISLDGRYDAEEKLIPGTNVCFNKIENLKRLPLLKRLSRIKSILSKHTFDTLMTYNFGAIEWELVNRMSIRIKSVHWEDGFGPEENAKPLLRRSLFRRIALPRKSKMVVPSQTLMEIAKRYWKRTDEQLVYFPNGIELPNKTDLDQRKAPTTLPVYGTLATLRAEKNIFRLIDAFIENGLQGQLLIGGDGPLLEELTSYVNDKSYANKIIFKGRITDIWGLLSQIDIFCISSDTEQMPISVLEAMAYGLPVISTDVGDIKSMLSGANFDFVVDHTKFSSAFNVLGNSPTLWSKIGNENFNKVKANYSFKMMVENFKKLT